MDEAFPNPEAAAKGSDPDARAKFLAHQHLERAETGAAELALAAALG